jgi:hypothetical protein
MKPSLAPSPTSSRRSASLTSSSGSVVRAFLAWPSNRAILRAVAIGGLLNFASCVYEAAR